MFYFRQQQHREADGFPKGLYLSDIQDHLITMTQNLNHYEKILSRSHSNYLAQISIEMTDANNQINDVLSKMTALGTVLIPMNLVTGLWGMNVHVPGQDAPVSLSSSRLSSGIDGSCLFSGLDVVRIDTGLPLCLCRPRRIYYVPINATLTG
jgi:hypothetical protein